MTIIKYANLDGGIDQLFSSESALAKKEVRDLLLNPDGAKVDAEIKNRFVKFAKTLKKIAPRSKDFVFFSAIFMHSAEAALVNQDTGEPIKDKFGKPITAEWIVDKKTGSWKWKCSDPNIKCYKNNNGDIFPEPELKKAYRSWVGRPLCKDHQSSSVDGIRGIIVDSYYDEKYKRVIGLCALDKVNYPDLARKVSSGYSRDVSMGTAVGKSICYNCGNVAKVESDYCNCVRTRTAYGEINIDLSPIELSLVVTGADPKAKLRDVIASLNRYSEEKGDRIQELQKAGCVTPGEFDRLEKEIIDLKNTVKFLVKSASIGPGEHTELRNLIESLEKATDDNVKLVIQKRIDEITADTNEPVFVEAPKVTGGGNYPEPENTEIGFAEGREFRLASDNNSNLHIIAINKKLDAMTDALRDLGNSVQIITQEDQAMSKDLKARAEARRAAVKNAYLQGGGGLNDPQTYTVDPTNDNLRTKGDKQMEGQGMEPGSDGLHPGYESFGKSEEELKKMLSRAELEERRIRRQALLAKAEDSKVVETSSGKKGLVGPDGKFEALKADDEADDDKINAAIDQYLKEHTKAYFQGGGGVNEPQTYPVDSTNDNLRTKGDKQMEGQGMESGSDGMHPGYQSTGNEKALKEKLLRADQKLRAKFIMAFKNDDKTIVDKANSRWEVYAGSDKVLEATGKEIFEEQLDSNWEFLASKRYARELIRTIRKDGLSKVAYLLKGAADPTVPPPAPAMPEGLDGPGGMPEMAKMEEKEPEKTGGSPKEIVEELTECLTNAEKLLGDLKDGMEEDTGETEAASLPSAIEAADDKEEEEEEEEEEKEEECKEECEEKCEEDEADDVMYALDQSADELAMLTESLESRFAAGKSLRDPITAELYSLSRDAISSYNDLCKKASLVIAAKKEKKEEKKSKKEEKKEVKKDKKEDKKEVKKYKKDGKMPEFLKKKFDKKEEKGKAEAMLENLLKTRAAKRREMVREAEDMGFEAGMDDGFDEKVKVAIEKLFGKSVDDIKKILAEEASEPEHKEISEEAFVVGENEAEDWKDADGLAQLLDEAEGCDECTVDQSVTASNRKAWRQKIAAEATKKYQMSLDSAKTVDTDMPVGKSESLGDLSTKSTEAVVEGIVEMHDEIMKQVNHVPAVREAMSHLGAMLKSGKLTLAQLNDQPKLKALAIDPDAAKYFREYFGEGDTDAKAYGNELVQEFEKKKVQASLDENKARVRRAYDLALEMQEKGMIGASRADLDVQVDEIMKFDARSFESVKKAIARMSKTVKVASSNPALQVGVNTDEVSSVEPQASTLVDQLKGIW
jgi:hypothetical protein